MRRLHVIALLGALAASASAARADELGFTIRTERAPEIEVRIDGVASAQPHQVWLRDASDPSSPTLRATRVVPFRDGPDPVAVAIVYATGSHFVGDERGAFAAMQRGLAALELPTTLPKGSEVALITYGQGAQVRRPLSPAATFDVSWLGTPAPSEGNDIDAGIDAALDVLDGAKASRRMLLVYGAVDGTFPHDRIVRVGRRVAQGNVRAHVAIWQQGEARAEAPLRGLAGHKEWTQSAAGLEHAITAQLGWLTATCFAYFDAKALRWDGREHELVVTLVERDAIPTALPELAQPTAWRPGWTTVIAILATLLVLGAVVRHKLD